MEGGGRRRQSETSMTDQRNRERNEWWVMAKQGIRVRNKWREEREMALTEAAGTETRESGDKSTA